MIAVVGSHCLLATDFFNLFHNPLFMLSAGIFHSQTGCETLRDFFSFFSKKIQKVYIPFVAVTMFLTLFQPIFSYIRWDVNAPYALKEMAIKLLSVLFMRVEYLNGPCWFLIAYLEISVFFEIIRSLLILFQKKTIKRDIPVITGLILFSISILFFVIGQKYNFPRCMDEAAVLFLWYTIGFLFFRSVQKLREKESFFSSRSTIIMLIASVISISGLFWISSYIGASYAWKKGENLLLIAMFSLAGMFCCWLLSQVLERTIFSKYFCYVGKNSFTIMTWHIVGFKILSSILIILPVFSIDELFGYVPRLPNIYWKCLYLVFGIFVPCILAYIWKPSSDFIINKLKKRFFKNENLTHS